MVDTKGRSHEKLGEPTPHHVVREIGSRPSPEVEHGEPRHWMAIVYDGLSTG